MGASHDILSIDQVFHSLVIYIKLDDDCNAHCLKNIVSRMMFQQPKNKIHGTDRVGIFFFSSEKFLFIRK